MRSLVRGGGMTVLNSLKQISNEFQLINHLLSYMCVTMNT